MNTTKENDAVSKERKRIIAEIDRMSGKAYDDFDDIHDENKSSRYDAIVDTLNHLRDFVNS